MVNKSKIFVIAFLFMSMVCGNAFAGEMKITLQHENDTIVFYDGDSIIEIITKIHKAPQIAIEDVFLCQQAEEGVYLVTIQNADGVSIYSVSDDFQVYVKNTNGERSILSCKVLNEIRGIFIQYLIENRRGKYLD